MSFFGLRSRFHAGYGIMVWVDITSKGQAFVKIMQVIMLHVVVALAAACGTLPDGKGWGEEVTLLPGWSRVGEAALSAWSRLEARAHYPSDVLAGVALGYYISAFIHDSFMGLGSDVAVQVQPSADGVQASVAVRF
jgi:hypothetical protein